MASSRRVQPARSCRQQPGQRQQRPSWAMTMGEMKAHVATNADDQGNLWCHLEGCRGTYTPYRVNVYGLRKTATNREEGHQMVPQQVQNVLRHLKEVHGIEKHLVTEALLPKGTPPFPELDELLTLRARVGSLERDVSGLEAIVLNLDESRKDFDMLESQMVQLLLDADNNRRFVPRGGPPEDELPGITDLRSVLHNREKRFYWRGYHDRREEEAEEEEEEEEKVDDSDVGVEQYSPPPASEDEDEGTTHQTALGGDQEEKEEEEQPPPSSQSTTYSLADILMNLTAPGPSHTQTRKRQWEGEEDQVPEEFQPLTESTPNDPQGTSHSTPAKRCRLSTIKRPAYEPANNPPPQKRPLVEEEHEEEDLAISVSLNDEEERLNLIMAASPPMSPRTRLWTPAPPRPPRFPHHSPPSSSFINREILRWMKEPPTPHIRPQ